MSKRPDQIDIYVGARIRALRNAKELSQTALAEQLGVTFQQVQKYENGVNRVGAGRLSRVAKLLGVEIGELYPSSEQDPKAKDVNDDPFLKMSQSKRGHRLARAFVKLDVQDGLVVLAVAEALSAEREKA
jgi:transcriptional regulator with XRE-family HTH domain